MFDRLEQIENRYEDLGSQLADPAIISDQQKYQKAAKQHRDLESIVDKFRQYRQVAAEVPPPGHAGSGAVQEHQRWPIARLVVAQHALAGGQFPRGPVCVRVGGHGTYLASRHRALARPAPNDRDVNQGTGTVLSNNGA